MLKRLFIPNNDPGLSWFKIILWWELRRILYNILLVAFGIFSLILLSFIIKDVWSFFSPPIFFLAVTTLFIIGANIFYTIGWVFQLATRNVSNSFIVRVKPWIFIYGILFSFAFELIPCALAVGYTIVSGKRIKSAYADFATSKPALSDIAGSYIIADESKEQLKLPDTISAKTEITLSADKTFIVKYFPHHGFGNGLGDYDIINATGKWSIDESQGDWVIPMHFETITNVETGYTEKQGLFEANSYHVNKDKPPYEIYIMVGDPDSQQGIKLQRK